MGRRLSELKASGKFDEGRYQRLKGIWQNAWI